MKIIRCSLLTFQKRETESKAQGLAEILPLIRSNFLGEILNSEQCCEIFYEVSCDSIFLRHKSLDVKVAQIIKKRVDDIEMQLFTYYCDLTEKID